MFLCITKAGRVPIKNVNNILEEKSTALFTFTKDKVDFNFVTSQLNTFAEAVLLRRRKIDAN